MSAPTVQGFSPSSLTAGTSGVSATVTGQSFQSGATVALNNGITVQSTTFVNSGKIDVTITVPTSASGSGGVAVTNPGSGNNTGTLANAYSIQPAGPS